MYFKTVWLLAHFRCVLYSLGAGLGPLLAGWILDSYVRLKNV